MKRRNILQAVKSLPFAWGFYIKNAFGCSMGMSLNFVNGLPEGYQLIDIDSNYIFEVVSKNLGRTDWVYANDESFINSPDFAENEFVIPGRSMGPDSIDKTRF